MLWAFVKLSFTVLFQSLGVLYYYKKKVEVTLSSWLTGSISWNSGNFIPLHFLDGCLTVDIDNIFESKITF